MNRTLKLILMLCIITINSSLVLAQTSVNFSIRFYDKIIYYTDSDILIKVTISNYSNQVFRFKMADEKIFSVRADVKTLTNRSLSSSDSIRKKESANLSIFYREIALQPGEEYSFDINLRDFIAIETSGTYSISCLFYPELVRNASISNLLKSNELKLSVRPGSGVSPIQERIAVETGEILKAQSISPDEVVKRTLLARQKSQWNEFFLYLDIEKLLLNNPERKKRYELSSEDERIRIREKYREELMSKIVDRDIVVVPASFEIIETQYRDSIGTVVVIEKFDSFLDESLTGDFYLIKEYTYELQKRDNIWYIVGYTVTNRGTEQKKTNK